MADERERLLARVQAWEAYERWRRAQPSSAPDDVAEAFTRNQELLALARRLGSLEEPSLEERVRGVETMRRALAALST